MIEEEAMKLHAVAPEGPRRVSAKGGWMIEEEETKLHAVAPGGPPEGQCEVGEMLTPYVSHSIMNPPRGTVHDQ